MLKFTSVEKQKTEAENGSGVRSNPYKASAGESIDQLLNEAYFPEQEKPEKFSTDAASAKNLVKRIESAYIRKVVTGTTKTKPPLHFARLETDPSTSTETTAETYPLAVARLGLVLALRRSSR